MSADFIAHINQGHHNYRCAKSLSVTPYQDWAITAAFYAAIHFAEACFTTRGGYEDINQLDEKHYVRLERVRRESKDAYHDYRKLYNASKNVRYLIGSQAESGKLASEFYNSRDVITFVKSVDNIIEALQTTFGVELQE